MPHTQTTPTFIVSTSPANPLTLTPLTKASFATIMCLAAAHALVKLEDGTIVGDPMERATLESVEWEISKGAPPTSFLSRFLN
jgi:cation-transporting ATPase 13A1